MGQQWAGFMAMNSGERVFPIASTISTECSLKCLITARGPWELAASRLQKRDTDNMSDQTNVCDSSMDASKAETYK